MCGGGGLDAELFEGGDGECSVRACERGVGLVAGIARAGIQIWPVVGLLVLEAERSIAWVWYAIWRWYRPWNGSYFFASLRRTGKQSVFNHGVATLLSPCVIYPLTCSTCDIDMVGFPPFFFMSSSGSYNVLPTRDTISTFASRARRMISASRPLPYVSVSFSKTR